jgi:amino acid adenylation domain-containing protein/non-ribosomal peptide synthase protein (TIGR01720 family)
MDRCFIELFEEQVVKTPDHIALIFEGRHISYRDLDFSANQLAYELILKGVKSESLVPLCVERGPDMIIGLLGIMKAGGAYIPIDSDNPLDRIAYLIQDSQSNILVTNQKTGEKFQTLTIDCIVLDSTEKNPGKKLPVKVNPGNLAYVIYTSGSTGKPKGVMIEHRNLTDYLHGLQQRISINECNSYALISTFAADLGNTSIFTSLITGATLHLFSRETATDIEALHKYFAKHSIDCLKIVPSHWKALSLYDKLLLPEKFLIFGGEVLQTELVDSILASGTTCQLVNHYGPTETTIGKLLHVVDDGNTYGKTIPIGKPFSNTKVLILTEDLELCPLGVPGQLFITGDGIARGYLNNPEFTAEKFIQNPFTKQINSRMYSTGDLVKYLPDRNIEFLGRTDDQIKIRGNRVELGEVELVIQEFEFVKQVAVIARDDHHGNKRLLAYVVPESEFDKEALLVFIREKLPDYMIPLIIELDALPLNANGKIDRKSLPDPDASVNLGENYVAPGDETEMRLAKIWENVLDIELIGVHDDFFELGGHSLLAIRLISAIRNEFKVEMPIGEIFDFPTIAKLKDRLKAMEGVGVLSAIKTYERPKQIPLSFSQERLWFIDQLEGSLSYHVPVVLNLKGPLDELVLQNAMQKVINRHEILRTVIKQEDGIGFQHILPRDQWHLEVSDNFFSSKSKLNHHIQQLLVKAFDLSADSMIRAHLLKLSDEEAILVIVLHHIASDGWSKSIMVREFAEFYNAEKERRAENLKDLPVQYADFAIWQRQNLQGEILEKKLSFWKEKLNGLTSFELPSDFVRPLIPTGNSDTVEFKLDKDLLLQLLTISQKHNCTLFMTLLAAFKVLIYRYTGHQDICIGTPVAGRQQQEIEGLIGYFLNTLALRSELKDDLMFHALLQHVKVVTLEAYGHQEVPFEKVVEAVVKERFLSKSPLFQILFVFQNTPEVSELNLGNLHISPYPLKHETSKFDLTLNLLETRNGISGVLKYSTDVFKKSSIERLLGHFTELLNSIVKDPHQKIGLLTMLPLSEEYHLLEEFNDTSVDYPRNKTAIDLFESQVLRTPNEIAVIFDGKSLTYQQLNDKANQLAHYLIDKGARIESLIPLCTERGLDMIIGLLGILKSGAAYVPMDPEWPEDRIDYVLGDTSAKLIICNKKVAGKCKKSNNETIIIDHDWPVINLQAARNPGVPMHPNNLVYVLYTSGSTGRPKGVMVEHQALLDHCFGLINLAELKTCKSFALFAPLVFDAGHALIFSSLFQGSALHILAKQLLEDGEKLESYLTTYSVDCIKIVPSLWLAYAEGGYYVLPQKTLLFGGEKFTLTALEHIRKCGFVGDVFNHYGPTETTIGKSIHKLDLKHDYVLVPIGKPFSNTSFYVLSNQLQLLPIGVAGELYIAGEGLARGYLNAPELTAQKFIHNPFSNDGSSLMYKTGDWVRWLEDGNLEYIGRLDDQVKIRGNRIEPAEIEVVLNSCDLVSQAIVVAKSYQGSIHIFAYIKPKGFFDKPGIISYLKTRVTEVMIPTVWVELETIPLTINGKIDRKALPDSEGITDLKSQFVAPSTQIEIELAKVWKDVLGIEKIGVYDNFFELGGDSIMSIQIVSRARRAGIEFQVMDIFTHQTIYLLANAVAKRLELPENSLADQSVLSGETGLLPIQSWFFDTNHENKSHYNQSVLLQLNKEITAGQLSEAIEKLSLHHDALRLRFFKQNEIWKQTYSDQSAKLSSIILDESANQDFEQSITNVCESFQKSIDLDSGILTQFVMIETLKEQTHNRLFIVVHHLLIDGVSWRILLADLELILNDLRSQSSTHLGKKSSSYREWFQALKHYSVSERLQSQVAYWKNANLKFIPFSTDFIAPYKSKVKDTSSVNITLPQDYTDKLIHGISKVYHTEINDFLIAALAKSLQNWSGQSLISIGMEGHGREPISENIDTSRTVGWFTSQFPLLLNLEDINNEANLLVSVKEQLRQIPDKGLGYGVLKYVNQLDVLAGHQPWDILFNYLGQLDNTLSDGNSILAAHEFKGKGIGEENFINSKLSVNASISAGQLRLRWTYSSLDFEEATVLKIAENYLKILRDLIKHCETLSKQDCEIFTPSDYGLGNEIDYQSLESFLSEDYKDLARSQHVESIYRLSGLQEGLLFHDLYDQESKAYREQFYCEFTDLNQAYFERSWELVIQKFSILRTGFYHKQFSKPVQVVYTQASLPIKHVDLSHLDSQGQKLSVQKLEKEEIDTPFNLELAPLMRICLIKLSPEKTCMIWTSHHLLMDGWSMNLLMEEFLRNYESLWQQVKIAEPIADQYETYIRYTEKLDSLEAKAYWQNKVKDLIHGTFLPFIKPTSELNKGIGKYETEFLNLNENITHQVDHFVKKERITVNTLMEGVWAILLHSYTNSPDICFGTIVSGRPDDLKDVEKKVGLFINTLLLRTEINTNTSMSSWLSDFQQAQVKSRVFQYTPLQTVQTLSGVKGSLFDSLLVFENYPISKLIASQSWSLQVGNIKKQEQTNYPLTLLIGHSETINVKFSYNTALLDQKIVIQIKHHFEQVLKQIVEEKAKSINQIKLLTPEEEVKIIHEFNSNLVPYPKNKTILDLWDSQVKKSPQATAVSFGKSTLTYQELDECSNQLAHHLRQKGIKEEMLVPLCLERSQWMIISILGTLKAGAAYLPIDPEYPINRIRYMLNDSGSQLVISCHEFKSKFEHEPNCEILDIDTEWKVIKKQSISPVKTALSPHHLAYVIYTSGSTGQPKGVMNEHSGLLNRLCWAQDYFKLTPKDKILQKTTYSFDVSVWELLWPLISGAQLVFAKPGGHKDNVYLKEIIEKEQITMLHFVPSMLEVFLSDLPKEACPSLKQVLCSGEALKPSQVELFGQKLPQSKLFNLYGPTEAAIDVTCWEVEPNTETVPIGKPVANTQIYILNQQNQPVPIGVAGEIHIGGVQVARGYLNKAELTSEKFIPNPYSKTKTERLYKTGDLGKWTEDGTIEYLGRLDDQVKIRGYRIELGEIETAIEQIKEIKQSAVLAKDDAQGNKRLVAYVVSRKAFDKSKVMAELQQKLPEYMVPQIWVELKELPLTPNGKTDRKALPEPDISEQLKDQYAAPRNETEQKLVGIWQELFGLERVGINDNFFELGGDSILSIQAVSRAGRSGFNLQPKDIFTYQTIAELSELITDRIDNPVNAEHGFLKGEVGLLPIQNRYLQNAEEGLWQFNQSLLFSIKKTITQPQLQDVFEELLIQHDALRLEFNPDENGWKQAYGTAKNVFFNENLEHVDTSQLAEIITQCVKKYHQGLDILKGNVFNAVLIQTPASEENNRLFLVAHHLVIDGVSWRILLEDFEILLEGLEHKRLPDLGKKGTSYRQWQQELLAYGKEIASSSQLSYWQKTQQAFKPIPTDKVSIKPVTVSDLKFYQSKLSESKTKQLLTRIPKVYGTEINDILLTALALTLSKYANSKHISIGLEGHGREEINQDINLNRTVGWFTSIYPVLLETESDADISSQIKSIKEQIRKIPQKGLGYGVLKYMTQAETLQGKDPWDIIFNYLGQLDNSISESKYLSVAHESKGLGQGPKNHVTEKLSISCRVNAGKLEVTWVFSELWFDPATIKYLSEDFINGVESIIKHCQEQVHISKTPNDYGLSEEVNYKELDAFLDSNFEDETLRSQLETLYRLSGLQQGMLFHSLYDNRSSAYIERLSWDLTDIVPEYIIKSWEVIINKHSILRTSFYHDVFKVPVQVVHKNVNLPIEWLDFRHLDKKQQQKEIDRFEQVDTERGFDFKKPPLMRICLIRLSDSHYRMFWTAHHILFDGWSVPILTEKFLKTYHQLLVGESLPEGNIDKYETYIRYIEQQDKLREREYWSQYLKDLEQGTLLPFIRSNSERNRGVGKYKSEVLSMSAEQSSIVQNFAQLNRITVNTVMQAVWAFMLHQYTNSRDIVFGVVVSGRPENLVDVEKKVGMYINTLPFRSNSTDNVDLKAWLNQIQQEQIAARQFQYTPLHEIQQCTGVIGDLFDSILVFENFPLSNITNSSFNQLKVEKVKVDLHTNYPLTLTISSHEQIEIRLNYNTNLLDNFFVTKILSHFEHVLLQMVNNEVQLKSQLQLLLNNEKQQLLIDFNKTQVKVPEHETVISFYEKQVDKTPQAIAAIFEDKQISYLELNERSNQLAHYLIHKGISTNDLVPLCMERSIDMLVGLLGILKAGAAYVPLDSEYPKERLQFMVEDCKSNFVITHARSSETLQFLSSTFIDLDRDANEINQFSRSNPNLTIDPNQNVYVIYTSGSTGKPKGVLIDHKSLLDHCLGLIKSADLKTCNSFALFAPLIFDAGHAVIFSSLILGGSLHVISKSLLTDSAQLANYFTYNSIDFIKIVPSLWQSYTDSGVIILPKKIILFGGENCQVSILDSLRMGNFKGKVFNHYGPTEATIGKSIYNIDLDKDYSQIPIGKPFSNARFYVVGLSSQLQPIGVAGELWIGGEGLAKGYLNQPELTNQRFIQYSPDGINQERVYRSGDLCKWLPDGNLEYLGRIDDQVKIRGFRIELGEIESSINRQALVKQAVVLAKQDASFNTRLIAYVVTEIGFDKEIIINQLKLELPEYMIPAIWVELDSIPLTANGKINKKILPETDLTLESGLYYSPPETPTEIALSEIWKELLGLERVGIHSNFFELGGHSLLAMRMVTLIQRELNISVTIQALFQFTTINEIAKFIELNSVTNMNEDDEDTVSIMEI